ncbi:MAG: peptide chain release factor 1 [Candidatus Eisenbacteria bacterium]|nr:peptide chain release factor 1 [Candidatus Eisenbacteria bacterium]
MGQELLRTYEQVLARRDELSTQMSDPKILKDSRALRRIGREHARLEQLLATMSAYRQALEAREEAREILSHSGDAELVALAKAELPELEAREAEREAELKQLLVPRDPDDDKSAIVEIRAGTGGEEATLFAADLFRMYARFAERTNRRLELLSTSQTDLGGMKEVIFLIEGEGAYGALRFEGGVHRVQRVPDTEASGRIHTSAVSVAVFPEAEEVEVEINPDDLKVDVFRSSGPGGQSVNTTDSAVRVTHLPTGIVVQCQDERSQLKNKAKALKVLYAKLLDVRRQEQEKEMTEARRTMVSTGDRSAKIRTYNFPQSRVTDHRIGLTLYNLPQILEGNLEEFIEALHIADTERRLQAEPASESKPRERE